MEALRELIETPDEGCALRLSIHKLTRGGDCPLQQAEETMRGGLPFLCIRFGSITVRLVDRYAKNTGAVFSLKYHLVWCPKYRRPVLTGPVERRLKALLRLKAKEIGITIHALEIMPDHVPVVASDPRRCVAEIAARFKGFTSHVLREEFFAPACPLCGAAAISRAPWAA
jgi:putative transposase